MYEYEMFFDSTDSTSIIKIDGWLPIAFDAIEKPENIEKYIKNGLLRRIEPIEIEKEIIIEKTRPIFICKLFFDKSCLREEVNQQRVRIEEYFEEKLNDEYNILVLSIGGKYKEAEFEVLNVEYLKSIDFETFKKDITDLIEKQFKEPENHIKKCYDRDCGKIALEEFNGFCSKECRANNTTA